MRPRGANGRGIPQPSRGRRLTPRPRRSEDKSKVILHTTLWMHAAHRLYSGLGFKRTQRLDIDLPQVCLIAFVLEL